MEPKKRDWVMPVLFVLVLAVLVVLLVVAGL